MRQLFLDVAKWTYEEAHPIFVCMAVAAWIYGYYLAIKPSSKKPTKQEMEHFNVPISDSYQLQIEQQKHLFDLELEHRERMLALERAAERSKQISFRPQMPVLEGEVIEERNM